MKEIEDGLHKVHAIARERKKSENDEKTIGKVIYIELIYFTNSHEPASVFFTTLDGSDICQA